MAIQRVGSVRAPEIGTSFDSDRALIAEISQRQPARQSNGAHAGQGTSPSHGLIQECSSRHPASCRWPRACQRRGMPRVEPGVARLKFAERSNQQHRAGDEEHRHRDLPDDDGVVNATRRFQQMEPQRVASFASHRRVQVIGRRKRCLTGASDTANSDDESQSKRGPERGPAHGRRLVEAVAQRKPREENAIAGDGNRRSREGRAQSQHQPDSIRIWRASRVNRPAPSAARMANSALRSVVRASTESAAALAHATTRSSATVPRQEQQRMTSVAQEGH